MADWFVYMVECGDGTLYTGITTDLDRRMEQHNSGTGAKYTRSRGPVHLVYHETVASHSEALKREYAIKQLTRQEKLKLLSRGASL